MVKMRLMRMGDKKNPIYRVVVVDSRKAATGEYIECVGHYSSRSLLFGWDLTKMLYSFAFRKHFAFLFALRPQPFRE